MRDVYWWVRWFVRYLPVLAWKRLTVCRWRNHGGRYDCIWCLTCAAPWFSRRDG